MPILFLDKFDLEMVGNPPNNFYGWSDPDSVLVSASQYHSPLQSVDMSLIRNLDWWGTKPALWTPFSDDTPIEMWFFVSALSMYRFEAFTKEDENRIISNTSARLYIDDPMGSAYGTPCGIYARDGVNRLIGTYSPDTFFSIKIVHNLSGGKYSVWIDSVLVAIDFAVEDSAILSIGAVGFRGRTNDVPNEVFMDDFKVGEEPIALPLAVKNATIKNTLVKA